MNLEPVIQSEESQREKINIIYSCIYMEYRKMVLVSLFAGKEWRHRYIEWSCGHSGGDREWNK